MRVLVTRPEQEARRWVDELRRRGFDATGFPLIAILPVIDTAPLVTAWEQLPDCRAVMFVSGNAVRHFFDGAPTSATWPAGVRAWSTGAGTRAALAAAGIDPACIDSPPADSAQFDSETLWTQVAGQVRAGDRVLIVRGGDAQGRASGRDWLADQLVSAGASPQVVVAYRRAIPAISPQQLAQAIEPPAVWLFSSSEAVGNLARIAPGRWREARAVATHPRIAQAARDAGFGVVCESRPSVDAVTAVLESFR